MCYIVHLTTVHRPFDTRIFQKECRSLAQAGYNTICPTKCPICFCSHKGGINHAASSDNWYKVSLVAPHTTREIVDGVEVIPIPGMDNRLARRARFTQGIPAFCRIYENLQSGGFDG